MLIRAATGGRFAFLNARSVSRAPLSAPAARYRIHLSFSLSLSLVAFAPDNGARREKLR